MHNVEVPGFCLTEAVPCFHVTKSKLSVVLWVIFYEMLFKLGLSVSFCCFLLLVCFIKYLRRGAAQKSF